MHQPQAVQSFPTCSTTTEPDIAPIDFSQPKPSVEEMCDAVGDDSGISQVGEIKMKDFSAAIDALMTETPLENVPRGKKENVFFVVDNSKNVNLPSNKRSVHWDDCGAYGR